MTAMIDCSVERRAQFGAAGRAIAQREFDKQIVIDRYLAAIEDALALRHRSKY